MTTKNKSALTSILISFFTSAWFLGATELPPKFSEPVNLSNNPNQFDTMAAIAVDQSNRIHVAWIGTYANSAAPDGVASDVFYSCSSGSGFSDPIKITVPTGWYSRSPSIAADSTGNAHIAFRRSTHQTSVLSADDIYYVTNATGAFSNPVLLVDGISGILKLNEVSMPDDPIINCDGQDRLHLTFRAFGLGSGLVGSLLVYINNTAGTWTTPTLIYKGTFVTEHSACMDRDNRLHIAFTDDNKIKYTSNTGGTFAVPVLASSSGHGNVGDPDIAIDSRGKAHIVYRAPFLAYLPEIYYVNNTSGSFSSWTPLDIDDVLHAKP